MSSVTNKIKSGSTLVFLWLGLVFLAAVFSYAFYEVVVIIGVWLTKSETFRPRYWNFTRLKWLAKITGVVVIGFWIFFMAYLESQLGTWHKRNLAVAHSKKLAIRLVIATAVCLLIAQVMVFAV